MNSLELFAGAGGLALGIKAAGFKHLAVIERDTAACDAIRENSRDRKRAAYRWPVIESDVRNVDFNPYREKVDLVSGGPPCQPFSIGGKHKGQHDSRDLFPEAARVVRTIQPRAFIFENVRGLLRRSFARYFQYVLLQLQYPEVCLKSNEDWTSHLSRLEAHHTQGGDKGLHYRVVFRLMNAADYGVPQKRERVVIVGFRSDIGEDWSFPKPTHSEDGLLFSKWVSGGYWDEHKVPRKDRSPLSAQQATRIMRMDMEVKGVSPWRTIRDAIADLPDPRLKKAARIPNHRFQAGAKVYPGHTGSHLDEPAKTLKAGDHGVPGGENMLAYPNGEVRYFTVRESARLQTFPDSYIFPSSWTESMRQIGNAVPVRLAEAVGSSVLKVLQRHQERLAALN